MKNSFLKSVKIISKEEQKNIIGKGLIEPIKPGYGFCLVNDQFIYIPCDQACPNGGMPVCI